MPTTAALLFISIYIFPFLGSGPKWRKVTKTLTSDICAEKLWSMLLFVNNIVNKKGYVSFSPNFSYVHKNLNF